MLWTRSTVEQAVFTRGRIESDENNSEVSSTVFDLLKVFQKIIAQHKEEVLLEIEREEMSLAEMLKKLKTDDFPAQTDKFTGAFAGNAHPPGNCFSVYRNSGTGSHRKRKPTAKKPFSAI